jgi:hypothetical protein
MPSPEDVKGEGFEVLGHQEPEQTEEEAPGQEEPGAKEAGPVQPLDVYMALRVAIAQLAGVAWQMLGLHADPLTGAVHKDVEQARIAIDATAVLVEKLLPHLQGQEARDYQSLLTDLRLNYVKRAGEPKPE